MKKHLILFSLFLIFVSCERGWIRNLISSEDEIADTIGPTVLISSHTSGQTVFDIITLTVDTEDDGGISKVEFFIDDSLVLTDTESPYQYDWNTTQYESNSEHIIKVISYDNSGNSTISQSILLKVDHTSSLPNGGNITSVTYTLTEMTVEWEESTDGDFNDYKVLYSGTENGDRDTLETYTDKSTTSYTITEFNPLVENWFWVQVTDTLGLSSIGTGMTNEIDNPPTQIDISSVTYDLTEMVVSWNQSNDNDFVSYELLKSDSENGTYTSAVVITDQSTTSHSITDYNPTQENWFKVKVTDYWGLNSTGSGMTNEIESTPPNPSILYPITYNDGFQISWSHNNDDDFQSYILYESLSEDMSNWTLVYETENRTDTTFFKTIQNVRYYQIVVEDFWGFHSTSNIEVGDYEVELWGQSYSVLNTTELHIGDNEFTGSIPPEIGDLTNLTYLSLYRNQLTGSIPPEIGNLTNLINLEIVEDQLTGEIPIQIGSLTNLQHLNLQQNQLTGSIPPEIGSLTNLQHLNLQQNQLTGSIPPEIGNLTNLTSLYLAHNSLTGPIPEEIWNLPNLEAFELQNNQLTGEIPESICYIVMDFSLSFGITNNQFCPPYPSCVENWVGEQDTSDCD